MACYTLRSFLKSMLGEGAVQVVGWLGQVLGCLFVLGKDDGNAVGVFEPQ